MDIASKSRNNMVLSQVITTSAIDSRLRDAMMSIPRQLFVPPHMKSIAYSDDDLPLGDNRYIPAPATLARMIHLAAPTAQDTVLDIAITTGYSTAIFATLAQKVIAIEADHEMASKANYILHSSDIHTPIIISSNPVDGHPDSGPYDVIFINGAVEEIPALLTNQLADHGRLVTVTYRPEDFNPLTGNALGMLTLIERYGNYLSKKEIMPMRLFPLEAFSPSMYLSNRTM